VVIMLGLLPKVTVVINVKKKKLYPGVNYNFYLIKKKGHNAP